jgi:aspartyl-tRNA(Asn)/glutamyl-tRNA(Gln) amidotransferase subunit C
MAEISIEQVKELAKLARIGLTKEEEESLSREMTSILSYVSELDEVDTSKIAPTSQVTGLENVLREDKVRPCEVKRDDLLANAPQREDGFIKVKKVLE